MGIGSKLDKILKDKNVSAIDLARAIGVPPSTIYSIIQRDNKKIDVQVLFDMAHFLGIDVEYFADKQTNEIETLAAHHDNEDWTEAELAEIEQFKQFVLAKRNSTPLPEIPTISIKKPSPSLSKKGVKA